MIFLETTAGLCNRMRSISSAYTISSKYNEKLFVIWPINDDLGCKFEDLFEKTKIKIFSVMKGLIDK